MPAFYIRQLAVFIIRAFINLIVDLGFLPEKSFFSLEDKIHLLLIRTLQSVSFAAKTKPDRTTNLLLFPIIYSVEQSTEHDIWWLTNLSFA